LFPDSHLELAEQLLTVCRSEGLKVVCAESCTGGLVSGCLTAVSGASAVVDRGFVTYSNEAKTELLGVPEGLLAAHGAVSAEVAQAMAEGALERSRAHLSVAVTGIAGPGGGTPQKPVGLVYLATAARGRPTLVERHVFAGDRDQVRESTVRQALHQLLGRTRP
jgi:nicotinamide-nucleotide amidase